MLEDEGLEEIFEITETFVNRGAQTIIITQLIVTFVLAISLKSMWNLMNVIQVLSYMRFFTDWPVEMIEILMYMDDAITLKPLTDPIFDFGKSNF